MADLSYDEAAHLLRRMGFGGNPDEIRAVMTVGREGAVDHLINYQGTDNQSLELILNRGFDFSNPFNFQRFNRVEIQRWWLTRMIYSRRQFEEKMTLFWHNHFATALSKVPDLLMYIQNQTLRRHALDRFDTLLLKVAQDPAMLVWLDGITNVRGRPNENFAREFQELFTMGITDVVTDQPNYTEDDVKEISRAFTGWKFAGPRGSADPFDFRFFINPPEHDNGPKTIYGQTANFSGEDVITILSARRATARFLVKQLFEFFVYPLSSSSTDKSTIEKFADVYLAKDHSIRELARAVFTSDEFFSQRARFALIKSPVEYIVGAIKMLGVRHVPGTSETDPHLLEFFTILLGQELFNPPDVAGWDLNLGWIDTARMLNRFTYADFLAINRPDGRNAPGLYLDHEQLRRHTKANPKKTVKSLLSLLGPLKIDSATRKALIDYLNSGPGGSTVKFANDDFTIDKKVRGLVHLIMCLSEFQLN